MAAPLRRAVLGALGARRAPVGVPARRKDLPASREAQTKMLYEDYISALYRNGVRGVNPAGREWTMERAVREAYTRVVWVYKCVEKISSDASSLPFVVRPKADPESVIDGHALAEFLDSDEVNPLESGRVLRKRISQQTLLSPRGAFVEVTYSRRGQIVRADLLPAGRTRPVPATGANAAAKVLDHFETVDVHGGKRQIDPKYVRWFREPHPDNTFWAMTPLEAAGLSVDLDYLVRLFNVSWLNNDGRPGMLVVIKGDATEETMARLAAKFAPGPIAAGQVEAVTGDGVQAVDFGGKPRDLQYKEAALTAKAEILAAFGLGETVLGSAAGLKYANAAEEGWQYWSGTMANHLRVVTDPWKRDVDPDQRPDYDTSEVPALELPKRQELEVARAEVQLGVRSPWSYLELAGRTDEAEDIPELRAFYVPSGLQRLPASVKDREELAKLTPPQPAGAPPGGRAGPGNPAGANDTGGLPGGQPAGPAAPRSLPGGTIPPALPAGSGANPAAGATGAAGPAAAVAASPAAAVKTLTPVAYPLAPARPAAAAPPPVVVARIGFAPVTGKTTPAPPAGDGDGGWRTSVSDPADRDRLEAAVAATLGALVARWAARTEARLRGVKARKGTRHWSPATQYKDDTRVGTAGLDAADVVDAPTWQDDAEQALTPLLTAAAAATLAVMVTDLGWDTAAVPPALLTAATGLGVAAALRLASAAVTAQADALAAAISAADAAGQPLDGITAVVRGFAVRQAGWALGVSVQVATATLEGARDALASAAAGQAAATGGEDGAGGTAAAAPQINRTWLSRRDAKVRPSHVAADGQNRPPGVPFTVGAALLRFPGDPLGPPAEVRNCRCRLLHRARGTGRFVPPPPAGKTLPTVHVALAGKAEFDAGKHPRDRHGRFAHVGEHVHLPDAHGGGVAEVTGHPGGGRLQVRRADGGTATVPAHATEVHVPFTPEVLSGTGNPDGTGAPDDPIDVRGDIPRAVQLLGEGKHVRLNRPEEAATLLDEVHRMVADARAKGAKAPTYDLCKVSVPNTNLFCADHKGVPRAKMPQLAGTPQPGSIAARVAAERGVAGNGKVDLSPEFRAELGKAGVGVRQATLPASHLHASQMQLDGPTVAALPDAFDRGLVPRDAPIFITRDGYILDGHHRWAARVYEDVRDGHLGDEMMNVEVVDMDIGAALDFANAFAATHGIAPETVGGKRLVWLASPGRRSAT